MIRPMRAADKGPVMDLIMATGFFTPDEVVVAEELIDVYLSDEGQKDYRVEVAEDEAGRVVGYMTWGPTPMTEGTYDLYWMAVSPAEQGKGRGREMVDWLENKVAELNGRHIIIETSSQPKYHPTRQFYLKINCVEAARIRDFYRPGDDRVIYVKKIR